MYAQEIDLKDLMTKVSSIQNSVVNNTFDNYMICFQKDGNLKNGMLNLNDIDESEREEFIEFVGHFDQQFTDMMIQSI